MLRKNDRISKQKKMNISIFNTTLSSIVILQTILFSRFKFKNRVINNKLNLNLIKSYKISKRQKSNFSQNKIKIYN